MHALTLFAVAQQHGSIIPFPDVDPEYDSAQARLVSVHLLFDNSPLALAHTSFPAFHEFCSLVICVLRFFPLRPCGELMSGFHCVRCCLERSTPAALCCLSINPFECMGVWRPVSAAVAVPCDACPCCPLNCQPADFQRCKLGLPATLSPCCSRRCPCRIPRLIAL